MEYRPEMFVGQDKEFPKAGNLKCIGTAFYNLFITQADPEHLNISFQMEDSVVERLKFYRTRVLKEKTYPVFGPVGLYRGNPASVECFQQVTGLPVDKILNEPLPREVDERFIKKVMSKIAFTYVCDYGVGELDEAEATPEILHTNRPCVVNLVNYLIGRGIFMPNIEKLLSDDSESFPDYPVYADFDVLPDSFRRPIDPVELFLSFRVPGTNFDLDSFRKFSRLVKRPPEAAFHFAFQPPMENDPVVLAAKAVLRDYFSALIKPMVNEYFEKYFQIENFFPKTVLDHDSGLYPLANRFVYLASNFVMTARTSLVIEKETESQIAKSKDLSLNEEVHDYRFSAADREGIALAYDAVKKHFLDKGLTIYPELFLRLMGLPYPAYEVAKYFSFENGTGEEFANLFQYDEFDLLSYALPTFLLDDYGEIKLSDPEDTSFVHYLLPRFGVFFLFDDIVPYELNYTVALTEKGRKDYPLPKNNGPFVRAGIEALNNISKKIDKTDVSCTDLLVQDGKGNYPQVSQFFLRIQNGEFSMDVLTDIFGKDEGALPALNVFLFNLLGHYYLSQNKELFKTFQDRLHHNPFLDADKETVFFAQSNTATVLTDRSIVFFTAKNPVFLEDDRLMMMQAEEIYKKYFSRRSGFYVAYSFLGEETASWIYDGYAKAMFVTGLTREQVKKMNLDFDKPIVSQLDFRKEENFFEFGSLDFASLYNVALLNSYIHRSALLQWDVYLTGRGRAPLPVLMLDPTTGPLAPYLKRETIAVELAELEYPYPCRPNETEEQFLDRQVHAIRGEILEDVFPWESAEYVQHVNSYMYLYFLGCLVENLRLRLPAGFRPTVLATMKDVMSIFKNPDLKPLPSTQFESFYDPYTTDCVSVGHFFPAYSKVGLPGTFYMDADDRLAVERLYRIVRNLPPLLDKGDDTILRLSLLGMPIVFAPKDLKKPRIPFRKVNDPEVKFSYDTLCHLKNTIEDPYRSTLLRQMALREGFVLFSDKDLLSEPYRNVELLVSNLKGTYQNLTQIFVFADTELSGMAKEFFLPERRTFETLLHLFIRRYSQTTLSSEFLFYGKEAIEYLYNRNPAFLVEGVNALHTYMDFLKVVKKALGRFSIPELENIFPLEFIYYFIALFVFFVEQNYLVHLYGRHAGYMK